MDAISVGILLVGRLGSTRLREKLLLQIDGVPIVQHTAVRLLRAKNCSAVVMCTTTDSTDDALAALWSDSPVQVFRGSPHDPFRRMLACAEHFGFSHFIYAGADDVLLDPELCDFLTARVASTQADMTLMENIVCGFTPFLFSTTAARRLVETVRGVITIPEKYMKDMDGFTVDEVPVAGFEHLARPEIRATLDYREDFEFFKVVISSLQSQNPSYTNRDVMDFLSAHPEVVAINIEKHAEWVAKQAREYQKVR